MHATVHPLVCAVFIPVSAVMAVAVRCARAHDQAPQQVLAPDDTSRVVLALPRQLSAVTTIPMVVTSSAALRVSLPHARSSGAAR